MTPLSERVATKLDPDHLKVSPKFHAILGYILRERFTNPSLTEIVITSDGILLGQTEGDIGANEILGEQADLERNLAGLSRPVGLDLEEDAYLQSMARARIKRF